MKRNMSLILWKNKSYENIIIKIKKDFHKIIFIWIIMTRKLIHMIYELKRYKLKIELWNIIGRKYEKSQCKDNVKKIIWISYDVVEMNEEIC